MHDRKTGISARVGLDSVVVIGADLPIYRLGRATGGHRKAARIGSSDRQLTVA